MNFTIQQLQQRRERFENHNDIPPPPKKTFAHPAKAVVHGQDEALIQLCCRRIASGNTLTEAQLLALEKLGYTVHDIEEQLRKKNNTKNVLPSLYAEAGILPSTNGLTNKGRKKSRSPAPVKLITSTVEPLSTKANYGSTKATTVLPSSSSSSSSLTNTKVTQNTVTSAKSIERSLSAAKNRRKSNPDNPDSVLASSSSSVHPINVSKSPKKKSNGKGGSNISVSQSIPTIRDDDMYTIGPIVATNKRNNGTVDVNNVEQHNYPSTIITPTLPSTTMTSTKNITVTNNGKKSKKFKNNSTGNTPSSPSLPSLSSSSTIPSSSFSSVITTLNISNSESGASSATMVNTITSPNTPSRSDKGSNNLRSLKKKLREIDELEKKVSEGYNLSPNQHEKILRKTVYLTELNQLMDTL